MVRERCRGESEECDEERIEVRHTQGTCVSLRTASNLEGKNTHYYLPTNIINTTYTPPIYLHTTINML